MSVCFILWVCATRQTYSGPKPRFNPADISDARLHYIFIEQAYPLKGFGDSRVYMLIPPLRHGAGTEISEIGNSQYNRVYMLIRPLRSGVGGGEILRIGNSQVGKDYILSAPR